MEIENSFIECDYDIFDYYELYREEGLLTNFSADQLELYQKAVEMFGDDTLYISNEAYDIRGNTLETHYSLRTTVCKDRTKFWNLFESIEKESEEVL